MKRRTFLEIALVLGAPRLGSGLAGLADGGSGGLAWSHREGFPGLRVRLDGLAAPGVPRDARLHVVDVGADSARLLLDQPVSDATAEWRIPSLRSGLADTTHALEARLVAPDGSILARTDPPLTVRFRAFRFSV